MKERIDLESVVLLGRTFEEYCTYFQLNDNDLRSHTILDLAAGVSSFCAGSASRGYNVTAADPIYTASAQDIAHKSETDLIDVLRQLPDVLHKYNWTFYKDPADLGRHRKEARRAFLEDYAAHPKRYVPASLPVAGFGDRQFSIILVSYFLFLYDDLFDYDFHKRSVLEAARIAKREVRIYPLVNLRAEKSVFVEMLLWDPDCSGLEFNILKSDFEFVKNSNELLIIRRV